MNQHDLVDLTIGGERRAARPASRRETMQWVLAAVAASAMPGCHHAATRAPSSAPAQAAPPGGVSQEIGRNNAPQAEAAKIPNPTGVGYGTDPQLAKNYKPGDVWPLTLDAAQKSAATALADTILPHDDYGPAASEVGVIEMIDEWVSAPYPQQVADRPVILDGLKWLDDESVKRFKKHFAKLDDHQCKAICDDVCSSQRVKNDLATPARFFSRFRDLCAAAYYATPAGWKAIGYVGNVALERFDGPPQDVLDQLGVTQTVR